MTLGIDNIMETYSFVYFYGVDSPTTAPYLEITTLACVPSA